MTPCGSWRVTLFEHATEAVAVWCARTQGACPFPGSMGATFRVDNRPCAATVPEAFNGSLSTQGQPPTPLVSSVDNPPPAQPTCMTCGDTGIAGYADGKPYPCRVCGAHERLTP